MAGITDPSEEYFKDGLWGWASTAWEKLVSSGGRLFTALHGWDGSAWRKLPIVWGYSDRWAEAVDATATGAGNASANTDPVSDGYVHVLQGFHVNHDAVAAHEISVYVLCSGIVFRLYHNLTFAPDVYHIGFCQVTMKKDDTVNVFLRAPGDGKTVELSVIGYKMKVAE